MGAINKLSAGRVSGALPDGMHSDGGGLYLKVAGGSRAWVFRYRWSEKRVLMGLGPLRDVTLAQARAKAARCRQLLLNRQNPIEIRDKGDLIVKTFGEVADAYIAAKKPGWKNAKHVYQWEQTLGDAYCKSLRAVTIDKVEERHVLEVLRPVWSSKPETATRLRGRIEQVLDAARVQGLRTGENPARWRGHLSHMLAAPRKITRGHHKALAPDAVPDLIASLRAKGTVASACLEWTILTAVRTGEAIGAKWPEIEGDVWVIPASRMKASKEHRVPLTPRCLELLDDLRQLKSEWVFPGQHRRRHLSNMAMLVLLRKLGIPVTVHGFRSTFRDWAGDRTSFPREVIEMALAHVIQSETEAAYRRSDALAKRRKLLEAWARFCEPAQAGNVFRLRG